MIISFRAVYFAYENFNQQAHAARRYQLRHLTFQIAAHEFVAVVGRSGSGKSTLLQMFTGLLPPSQGEIQVDGQNIHDKNYDLTALRRRIGLVFQFPEIQLFAQTVREDISFAPSQQRFAPDEITRRTLRALAQVGLSEDFLERNPLTLSEGEKRRVAIAGVLAMEPDVLVLDEPTASLDARGIAEFKELLQQWHRSGKAIVIISHDSDLVAQLAQRVLILHEGGIIFDGTPAALWEGSEDMRGLYAQAGLPVPRVMRMKRLLAERSFDHATGVSQS